MNYEKYIGQYVKRFYTPFTILKMYKIGGFRNINGYEEVYFTQGEYEDFWTDVEDSIIITNELPIIEDEGVANVNSDNYKGYNPFTKQTQ